MVVVEQMDLPLSRQVDPLTEAVLAVELVEGQHARSFQGVEQRTQVQMMSLFDFQYEVSPL